MVPGGDAVCTLEILDKFLTRKSRQDRKRSSVRLITGSPSFSATMPARCTNTGAHEVLYSISLPRSTDSAGGTTSQPSRQPVISQDLENVFALTTRSSGSDSARNDGADFPSPKKSRS